MKIRNMGKGYFCGLCSGILFGMIPIIVLLLNRDSSIPSTFTIMLRMLLAGVTILPFALSHWETSRLSVYEVCKTAFAGVLFGVTVILLYESYNYIPSGVGIVLHYTYPLIVLVINAAAFRQRISHTVLFSMLSSLSGIALLCDITALPARAGKGIFLALSSSVAFCTYLIWVERKELSYRMHPTVFTMVVAFSESATLAVYNAIKGYFDCRVGLTAGLLIMLIAMVALIAILTQTFAIKGVGASLTAILGTTEPIVCTIGSALILHDRITARMLFGAALVLTATVIVTIVGAKEK